MDRGNYLKQHIRTGREREREIPDELGWLLSMTVRRSSLAKPLKFLPAPMRPWTRTAVLTSSLSSPALRTSWEIVDIHLLLLLLLLPSKNPAIPRSFLSKNAMDGLIDWFVCSFCLPHRRGRAGGVNFSGVGLWFIVTIGKGSVRFGSIESVQTEPFKILKSEPNHETVKPKLLPLPAAH